MVDNDRPPLGGGSSASAPGMTLKVLPEQLAIAHLGPKEAVPRWADQGGFSCITRTQESLTIVCAQVFVPSGVPSDLGWRCIEVQGPLDLSLTGILASLVTPLGEAGIPVFVMSSFETDFILVKQARLAEARRALERAGHSILDG